MIEAQQLSAAKKEAAKQKAIADAASAQTLKMTTDQTHAAMASNFGSRAGGAKKRSLLS